MNAKLKEQIVFGPFRFDCRTQRLWQDQCEIRLRARTLAVLRYLLEHPGRIIARSEFAQQVWGGTHVTHSVLRVCIWELRQALGDAAGTPRYIETVGQQGYRFCAMAQPTETAASLEAPFVGRQAELAALNTALSQAQHGMPQLVFIAGEPGIGKTALVRQFLLQVSTSTPLWISSGQCIEHFGTGEAYLPLLEAMGRLARLPENESFLAVLRRTAPMWLVHLPRLVEPDELEVLQHQVQGLRSERMLRQFVEALTVVTQETVVVLVLEDLQWSDHATVETLAYLARCPEPLRLLVLGTYRPAELIAGGHPLRRAVQELMAHGACHELRLELLTAEQVQTYVARRLGVGTAPADLVTMLYRRTDGNALFVVQLLDHLLQRGWLVEADGQWRLRDDVAVVAREVPEGLRALLLKQVEGLDASTQQVLDAASVCGSQFAAAEVAAMLQCPVSHVEARCDTLTRHGAFIAAQGFLTWPDGTATVCYEFRHVLYREVLYERLGMAQRARWHRLLGERLETGYGSKARELAGVLALHFEHGQDTWRVVQYQRYAAEQALSRNAYTEALAHCHRGLELLATLPESAARVTQELSLRLALSVALAATQGYAAAALADNLQQALTLCDIVEATTQLVPLLAGLTRLFMMRSDRAATERLLARQRALLTQFHDAASQVLLHTQLGTAETYRAAYAQAEVHQTHALHLYDPKTHRALALRFGNDPAVTALSASGWRLWLTGWPDRAAEQTTRALAHAETLDHPFSLAIALYGVAMVQQGRGEFNAALASAQRLRTIGHEQGFKLYEALGAMTQGSVLVQRDEWASGWTLLTTGLSQYRHLGSQASLSFFLSFLAETHLRQGQIAEGLEVIAEALRLSDTHFDRFWEAELHRQQGAKALELRAAMSLSRLWLGQDQPDAAQELLTESYGWFNEGLETADLQAAQGLLARCHAATGRTRSHLDALP